MTGVFASAGAAAACRRPVLLLRCALPWLHSNVTSISNIIIIITTTTIVISSFDYSRYAHSTHGQLHLQFTQSPLAYSRQHFFTRQRGCIWQARGADGHHHPPPGCGLLGHVRPPAALQSPADFLFIRSRFRYNYFDPDNYIATYALLQTGYGYLHEQVGRSARKLPECKAKTPHEMVFTSLAGAPRPRAQRRLHQRPRPATPPLRRRQTRVPSAVRRDADRAQRVLDPELLQLRQALGQHDVAARVRTLP